MFQALRLHWKTTVITGAVLAFGLAALQLTHRATADDDAANYPQASLTAPTDPAALIARGKYLVDAADCMPCHSGPNHAPYSGGLVLNTPFGGLVSPNITPDKETGIGSWTDAQFYRAIHEGISPGSSYLVFPKYLYPAMPFTSYTKLSYADVMAIKAYLFSLAPVNTTEPPNTLGFPFNQRPVLLGWRMLFFWPHIGAQHMDPRWDDHMKNGAYLTEALGHCGECHTPRNLMSGLELSHAYAGAPIDSYYAPNISSDKEYGIGAWATSDLTDYLAKSGNMVKGSAFGPMAEVVKYSLSQIPPSDVADIATYLQATTPQSTPPTAAIDNATASIALGATVYASNCAGCHNSDGSGRKPFIPNLRGNDAVMAAVPTNVIGAVLNGLPPWKMLAMPAFSKSLSDEQIAAVANYVRTSWGNNATADASPHDVMALRAVAVVPKMATMQADAFGCPHVSGTGGATTIADPGSNLLDIYNGATPETLPNRTRTLITQIRAGNATISAADLTNDLVAAYCPVVANISGLSTAAKKAALADFIQGAQPLIATN